VKVFLLGTTVKIVTVIDINTATCSITIEDSGNTEKVTDASMTKEADRVYSYSWQSSQSDDNSGVYTARITVNDNTYVGKKEIYFIMKDQSDK